MRANPTPTREGLDLQVSGPLCLSSDEPDALTWLIKTGSCVVGWAKMCHLPHHVGTLRQLYLSDSVRNPITIATQLLSAIFEYARDHGLLKIKVQRDCAQEHVWLRPALTSAGFSHSHDQQIRPDRPLHVYVDLYRSPRRNSRPGWAKDAEAEMIRTTGWAMREVTDRRTHHADHQRLDAALGAAAES